MAPNEQTLVDIESLILMWRSKLISSQQAIVDIEAQLLINKEELNEDSNQNARDAR